MWDGHQYKEGVNNWGSSSRDRLSNLCSFRFQQEKDRARRYTNEQDLILFETIRCKSTSPEVHGLSSDENW